MRVRDFSDSFDIKHDLLNTIYKLKIVNNSFNHWVNTDTNIYTGFYWLLRKLKIHKDKS